MMFKIKIKRKIFKIFLNKFLTKIKPNSSNNNNKNLNNNNNNLNNNSNLYNNNSK
jgi:hypothetical protein